MLDSDNLKVDFDAYKVFRDRCTHEDVLVGFRTNWLIWSQTSLILIWFTIRLGTSIEILGNEYFLMNVFSITIPVAGLVLSVVGYMSVRVAKAEINSTVKQYRDEYREFYESRGVPRIIATDSRRRVGHLFAFTLPIVYFILHVFMLVAAVGFLL